SATSLAGHHDSKVMVQTEEVMRTLHDLSGWAIERRVHLADLQVQRPALEDVYLRLTEPAK
ncbi:MAG TPA: hypothetical protein VE983_10480, partial [Solirubrobacteraceae bacterium]|nr:hypothetical protein [Solirubrobacteraceae bacterium]